VGERHLEAGAFHDTEILGGAVVLVDPDCEGIELIEEDNGFIMDSTRCAEQGNCRDGAFIIGILNFEAEG
jgi:hypothetical protein